MATRTVSDEPAVRKPLIYVGVAALAAVLGFVLVSHFLLGGGSTATPIPTPAVPTNVTTVPTATPAPAPNEETPGGSDPFSHPVGLAPIVAPPQAAVAATPAPKATAVAANPSGPHFTLSLQQVKGTAASLTFNGKPFSDVQAGDVLPGSDVSVQKVANGCATFVEAGKPFSVCQGQTVKH